MSLYIVFVRNEMGKLVETDRIEATDIHDAIRQTNGTYDVIEKKENKNV